MMTLCRALSVCPSVSHTADRTTLALDLSAQAAGEDKLGEHHTASDAST